MRTAQRSLVPEKGSVKLAYATELGKCFNGKIEDALRTPAFHDLKGKVDLIFTSPPFPLRRKKKYGNLNGEEYIVWLNHLAIQFKELLSPRGSIVIEMGNAWESRRPVMSTVPMRALMGFLESGSFNLCEEFIYYNNARLPTPVQWVNIERIRVKDAFSKIWWMSKSENPKASNRRILAEYSPSMERLLKRQSYNAGRRPSEHDIGSNSFLKRHKGSIPANVIVGPNTNSSSDYYAYCKQHKLPIHPARMPSFVAEFFIRFLTVKGDLVLDPFAGSNTTGSCAERLGRRWMSVEAEDSYVRGSKGRFINLEKK